MGAELSGQSPAGSDRKVRVLIVDDHPIVRQALRHLISGQEDLQVCGEAEDAAETLANVDSTDPDIVLLDLSLKDCNGIDLCKRLKARWPALSILVISNHDESLYAERALRAGAMGYINKQERLSRVIEGIRHVLAGKVYLSKSQSERLSSCKDDQTSKSTAIATLSDRELEVLEQIGHGLSTRQIAQQLHISVKTVESHREHIKRKLSIESHAALIRQAVLWVLQG